MPHSPLLVLAAGQRCGSTLLQRLLSSNPKVHIWGEHGGHLDRVLTAAEGLIGWAHEYGQDARNEFEKSSYQGWMANLSPEQDRVVTAMRSFVELLYAEPAAALGRPVWGFKEVRYGPIEAQRLQRLFPELAVIFLVRDPRDVLRSLDEWERWSHGVWTRARSVEAMQDWKRVARTFVDVGTLPALRLRYEDMIANPAETCRIVGEHTGLDPDEFDKAVFAKKIHIGEGLAGYGRDLRAWDELPEALRRLIDPPEMRELVAACGYGEIVQ
jgi:LPS sulfotransferase NodH